jgi:cytochrome c
MKAFGAAGNKWDDVTLVRFLTRPRSVVAETNMATAGIKDPPSVADVIAFLHDYSRQ